MDYPALAQELLSLRNDFDHLPIGAALADMSGGEFFALSLLLGRGQSLPSELGRAMHVSSARIAALLEALGPEDAQEYIRLRRRLLAAGRLAASEEKEALS